MLFRSVKMTSISACVAAGAFASVVWLAAKEVEFDSRVFVLPEADVCNYFLWRQQDAERNSIAGCAQSMFSHARLQGLSSAEMQELMFQEKGFNWNDYGTALKRGRCVRKRVSEAVPPRSEWFVDQEIPRFGADRAYIEDLLETDEQTP